MKKDSKVVVTERSEIVSIDSLKLKLDTILSGIPSRGGQLPNPNSLMQFKRTGLSLALMQETMDYTQHHLAASLCIAACNGESNDLTPETLLRRCGIFSTPSTSSCEGYRCILRKCLGLKGLASDSVVEAMTGRTEDLTAGMHYKNSNHK